MDNIEELKKIIAELESENSRLKSSNASEVFSFGFLFDAVKQPAFILEASKSDALPVISKINKSGLELVKFSFEECKKLTPVELGLLNSQEQYTQFVNSLSSSQSVTYLGNISTKNGQTIKSELTLYSFSKKNAIHLLVFQRNIGNQQKVVEALRQSEYRFLQMAENISEGITIAEQGKVVFVNSSMTKITGYSKEQLADIDEFALARNDEVERIKAFKQKLTDYPKGIHGIEFWIKTKSGQEKCIKNNYTFSSRGDGKQSTYIITSDITASKRIEQALRKSQSDFKMLAENSPDIITRYSKELKYIYVNATVEKRTGIPVSEFIGRNNLELNLDSDLVSFLEEMHLEVFRTGKTLKFEYRIAHHDEIRIFQAHLVPEMSKDGKVESVLNVSRDITQIKQVERTLKQEKQNIIEENLLIADNLEKWSQNYCTANNVSLYEASCLQPILRIAEWTRYGHIHENIELEKISVNDFIKDLFNKNASLIDNKNIEANIFLPVIEVSIFSDKIILEKTLKLLFENAVEATTSGKIEIGYDIYNDKEIVFFVKDTGCGINPDDTERVFKPFVCINKENHAGLGLSIAEKNVESLNGIIWCLSAPDTGSTFCFTHPAQVENAISQHKAKTEKQGWKGKKVLVVEDTDTNYFLVEAVMSQYGAEIERAITGNNAVKMAKENSYNLILMDIQLPGINGYEATKQIRKFNTEVPIIAQTAYAMYDNVVHALDAGCNDFVSKPIKTKKFISLLDKYLSA